MSGPEPGPLRGGDAWAQLRLDAHERGVLAGWLHVVVGLVDWAS